MISHIRRVAIRSIQTVTHALLAANIRNDNKSVARLRLFRRAAQIPRGYLMLQTNRAGANVDQTDILDSYDNPGH